jgi:lysine 2,3-aminomutase
MVTMNSPRALIEAGLGPSGREAEWNEVARRYAIGVPPALAALIDPTDPNDPIARQVLPDARELARAPHERDDPIGDDLKSPVRGLVHRYSDRVLLKLVSVCAVYCRFCFRRETVGPGGAALDEAAFADALAYIRARPEIWEVVITGGDPLALSPRRLAQATRALADIPHVKVLRWHTRLPVAAPERVTEALASALTEGHEKTVYVAVHANHARELTADARAACRGLLAAGVSLVSQTVLLKGVNDDADTLADLMRAFVETRIKPYYLHHPDPAPGTGHFRVSLAEGQALMRALRARLSGLATPTYVLDLPEARGKIPVGPSYLEGDGPDYVATDPKGGRVGYSDFG